MIGRTNATSGGSSLVKGGAVLASHSAGAPGMTDRGVVTLGDGKQYRLLEIKQSGTLSFNAAQLKKGIRADVCIVSGGQGGGRGGANHGGYGGRMLNLYGLLLDDLSVVIGAGGAGAASSNYGSLGGQSTLRRASDAGAMGPIPGVGTGGGRGGYSSSQGAYQFGDAIGKKPFDDASYFSPHCGGGGGGAYSPGGGGNYTGGAGGTNGGDGAHRISVGSPQGQPGPAGDASAGAGGAYNAAGAAASYYGGGGGGGGSNGTTDRNGGNGYQGVVWVRIPA